MKLTQRQGNILVEIIAMFIINIMVFLLSKFFLEITIGQCFLYSSVNTVWMTFILLPVIKKVQIQFKPKKSSYSLEPLSEYFKEFEKRQQKVQKEIEVEKKELEELDKTYRKDWKLFRKHLETNNIKHLYHFTDEKNIKSIIENEGLFSWHNCNVKNIKITRPGGNELSRKLDKKSGLENYVRLSFTPDHPMMYAIIKDGRIENPVVLEIDIETIFLKDSKFSDKNANRADVNMGQSFEDFSKIRFDILSMSDYLNSDTDNKPYFQAEVLVKDKISITKMTNIQRLKPTYA